MTKRIIAFILVSLIITCDFCLANSGKNTQLQAIADARRDAEQDVSTNWALAGFGCGVFAFVYAFVDPPNVPTSRLVGKRPEYIAFYMEEYKSAARRRKMQYACIGWGISAVVVAVVVLRDLSSGGFSFL